MVIVAWHSLFLAIGYLIGSIPFGVLVARSKGIDLRKEGSGNVGATNVGRLLGLRWFVLVFLLDFSKGFVPVLLASQFNSSLNGEIGSDVLQDFALTVGLGACLGHVFSIFLRFKGGKAVATGVGMLAALAPLAAACALATFALVFALRRMVSLASILASGLAPVYYVLWRSITYVDGDLRFAVDLNDMEWLRFGVITALCLMIVIKHRSNIRRLLRGEEQAFKRKAKADAQADA